MALIGRDAELAAIDEVLASARAGRGRAIFVTGEAGIGKSSVLGAARERAGGAALDGAAWESPGAPPYWPWIQVLRAARERFGAHMDPIPGATTIRGLIDPTATAATSGGAMDPAAARFTLVDTVARTLVALAAVQPVVVVLDDLHAADLPSLELLDLLCREAPRGAIAVIGAWREAELVARPDAARRLARVRRHAEVMPLRRLTADEVTRWVGADGARIHATTEGNPLFVEEIVRARKSGVPARGIASVLEDHLDLVSPATRDVLAAASVLGRELEPPLVPALAGCDDDAVARALREAGDAGLGDTRDARWVFRHVLLRDHLYAALPPSRRKALHRTAGEALERVSPGSTAAAHHLLAGVGELDVARAVAAARTAAARAIELHAFEDAAALLAAAVRALEATPGTDLATQVDVRLELARARHGSGSTEAAQIDSIRAAEIARALRDGERLSRAALVYSSELASGRRDPVMIELLEEALGAIPPGDSLLRARVTARLAAALVPTTDPEVLRPYVLADEAVAMADRLGDDETRMYANRYALHAHGFRLSLDESMPRVRAVVELSERTDRRLDAIEHRTWIVNAHLAAGDLAAADTATEPLAALLASLPQPHYRWRMPIIRAARAMIAGDFDTAERLLVGARQLAREHDLDRARMCCAFSMLSLTMLSRSRAVAEMAIDDVRAMARSVGGVLSAPLVSSALVVAGRLDEARELLASITRLPPIGLSQYGAEAALVIGDRALMEKCIPVMQETAVRAPLAYGASMSVVLVPVEILVGELLVATDRPSEAIAPLDRGLALSRRLFSPPFIARGTAALATALAASARPEDRARVAALRDEARSLAPRFGHDSMPTTATISAPRAPAPALDIVRDGDQIRIRFRVLELRVAPTKGLDYLAALVARPGAELHVSDLAGDDDRGDAGEVLDATARAAYKARAEELREELELAHARNDLGHIDRLTAELDMLADQLVASTGLGGRARRAGSRVERARVNVQRRIRDAIRRLATEDAALGRHLDATIRTGTYCSFTPLDAG